MACVHRRKTPVYPVSAINILKARGKSAQQSQLLDGYVLNLGRASQGMPRAVQGAKIALLDMNLQKVCCTACAELHMLTCLTAVHQSAYAELVEAKA